MGDYRWLNALWLLPVVAAILWYAIFANRNALRKFVTADMLSDMYPAASIIRPALKGILLLAGLGMIIIALARPQWDAQPREINKLGRDVCFIIDVSRSMLAEDLLPNRLERAKMWVNDTLEILHGDRVGLVVFAGNSVVKCPLTHDYGFMRMSLEDCSTASVSKGGTLIGDAIRVAMSEVFNTEESSFKDIILITDGEDHESFPVDAASAAGKAGIRIIVIGIGNENEGTRIPVTDLYGRKSFLTYEGKEVLSKLDAQTLQQVALSSKGGQYFNVATGTIELDKVYNKLVQQAEQQMMTSEYKMQYDEKFQIFLGIGISLLIIENLISSYRKSTG